MNNGSFIKLEFSAARDSDVNNHQRKLPNYISETKLMFPWFLEMML